MAAQLTHERDNLYRIDITGLLRHQDLADCERLMVAEMARIGPVRLLIVLQDFQGWDTGPGWDDLSFYARHGDRIERIAIVGPERWRSEALMFASAELRRAPVQYFPDADRSAAEAWIRP
jgi:hypothetical protein